MFVMLKLQLFDIIRYVGFDGVMSVSVFTTYIYYYFLIDIAL